MTTVTMQGLLQSYDAGPVLKETRKQKRKFLFSAGGFLRQTARRSLKFARKIRRSELDDDARESFDNAVEDFGNGYRDTQPRLGDIISARGAFPLLHYRPKSPLKQKLVFAVEDDLSGVTIGPKRSNDAVADKIEARNPFMGPAFEKFLPRIPEHYRKAI